MLRVTKAYNTHCEPDEFVSFPTQSGRIGPILVRNDALDESGTTTDMHDSHWYWVSTMQQACVPLRRALLSINDMLRRVKETIKIAFLMLRMTILMCSNNRLPCQPYTSKAWLYYV